MIPFEITNICVYLKNLKPKQAILVEDTITPDKTRAYKIWEVTLEDDSKEKIIQFKSNNPQSITGEVTSFLTKEIEELLYGQTEESL